MTFEHLCELLGQFVVTSAPFKERRLEDSVAAYLEFRGVDIERQKSSRAGRVDILVKDEKARICLELKKVATQSCVEQLDRYGSSFDGLILVCYRATRSLRRTFELAKPSAKIPIALVEIRKNCEMV